mmetsp:Transcript_16014/g.20249  ORF Transcript_16014/g.20249 Transcript_16014/m.20249 type:complete len:209 (+) Transcript_16014:362-988(+)
MLQQADRADRLLGVDLNTGQTCGFCGVLQGGALRSRREIKLQLVQLITRLETKTVQFNLLVKRQLQQLFLGWPAEFDTLSKTDHWHEVKLRLPIVRNVRVNIYRVQNSFNHGLAAEARVAEDFSLDFAADLFRLAEHIDFMIVSLEEVLDLVLVLIQVAFHARYKILGLLERISHAFLGALELAIDQAVEGLAVHTHNLFILRHARPK